MAGKLSLYQDTSATSQWQAVFDKDATWFREWTTLNQQSPEVVLIPAEALQITTLLIKQQWSTLLLTRIKI